MRRLNGEVFALVVYRTDLLIVGVYVFISVFDQGVVCPRPFPQPFPVLISRLASNLVDEVLSRTRDRKENTDGKMLIIHQERLIDILIQHA